MKSSSPQIQLTDMTDDERWRTVVRRDPSADGEFYYSVSTTGIYCRPSCASRQPRRENVRFHASCQNAERAGYRACKRCRPNEAALIHAQADLIAKACQTIATSEITPDLDTLAAAAGLSRFHFHRVFKQITGLTPKAYAMARRAERVRNELPKHHTVTEAIYEAGFNSNGRFYAKSSQMLGMRPKIFCKGGMGELIHFAVGDCSLGSILVASSEKGVCAILLGEDPNKLVQNLQDRFPKAQLLGGAKPYELTVAQVIGFVEAPGLGLELPLDLRGTAFQQRVWNALTKIPAGSTTSYGEIARHIGSPKAVRAVAGACAANALAVAIPCHRVVRNDRSLSGYRWGVERKQALLQREQIAS
ncbi:bifunctional DNA-binding transcriptional regulator/O6-methylguanine-DNA methyltransferase Ada [soil metagenome]